MKGEHMGVGRDTGVELSLTNLIVLNNLLLDMLDSILDACEGVDSMIYDAECTCTQDGLDFQSTVIDSLSQELGIRLRVRRHDGQGGRLKRLSPVNGNLVVRWVGCASFEWVVNREVFG